MTVPFLLLIVVAYFLGALPVAYLVAKLSRGIDLRRYGTGQVGVGNLLRMTASWRVSLPVGVFDFGKGALMVWVGKVVGLDMAQLVVVGLATIIGHNWSVFLHFSGGRGVGTAIGLIVMLPIANNVAPWPILTFATAGIMVLAIARNGTALPVLVGLAAVPLVTWWLHQPPLTLGFLAVLLVIVAKRLTARPGGGTPTNRWEVLLNRLLFDRDIRDRKAWMYRKPAPEAGQKKGS